jgi:hypothetical protein
MAVRGIYALGDIHAQNRIPPHEWRAVYYRVRLPSSMLRVLSS